jgi:hypothetical protein
MSRLKELAICVMAFGLLCWALCCLAGVTVIIYRVVAAGITG